MGNSKKNQATGCKTKRIRLSDLKKLDLLTEEFNQLKTEIWELRESVDWNTTGVLGYLPPKGTEICDKSREYAKAKELLEIKILSNMNKTIQERAYLESLFGNIKDAEQRLILRLRVVKGFSWSEIGDIIHADRTTAFRKFKLIVDEF